MLTPLEKILFALASLVSLYAAIRVINRLARIIGRGRSRPNWQVIPKRFAKVFFDVITFQPVFRFRFWVSLFHGLVAWAFLFYLFVNLGDILRGYFPNFQLFGDTFAGKLYRLGADLLSVSALAAMSALLLRRFVIKSPNLTTRADILLHPKARQGIRRDSAIVGGFILLHVGARFLGETLHLAIHNYDDPWQPFASIIYRLWQPIDPGTLTILQHFTFWLALGSILAFIPYFLYSKHIHLFFAPLNFLLKPERRSIGELSRLDFDDETIEQFGATHLEDLGWEAIMDAYACIMCYRCQEVCPAYNTGKVLSPAALEINKRYYLNEHGKRLAMGEPSQQALTEFAIPAEAVWACTACGACVEICPVGNEPMRDILEIRRALVLMENDFPAQLQTAFRGMERSLNPWNIPPTERMKWAEDFFVPTLEQNPNPEILWWVGCAPATDARAQKVARAFAQILNQAEVNYAVLGEQEQCSGDSARRAGNEYLFNELAISNVEMLNQVAPKRIVTTCPHCLHTLKNEYPAFGGHYQVIHHTQLIYELIQNGQLKFEVPLLPSTTITFHDPCYLGRQNNILIEPRQVLQQANGKLVEMANHGMRSFCCGAGGAQMWKEEEQGNERVSHQRLRQAQTTAAETLAVACPFCMIMLTDAAKDAHANLQILDIAEIILPYIKPDAHIPDKTTIEKSARLK